MTPDIHTCIQFSRHGDLPCPKSEATSIPVQSTNTCRRHFDKWDHEQRFMGNVVILLELKSKQLVKVILANAYFQATPKIFSHCRPINISKSNNTGGTTV